MAKAQHTGGGNVVQFPLVALEDNLLNIAAIAKLALFALENAEDDEWKQMKNEICTSLHMIRDQCDTGHAVHSQIARRRLELKP